MTDWITKPQPCAEEPARHEVRDIERRSETDSPKITEPGVHWASADIRVPDELLAAIRYSKSMLDRTAGLLQGLKTLMQALSNLAILLTDPAVTLIQTTLSMIEKTLQAFAFEDRIHLLIVPPRLEMNLEDGQPEEYLEANVIAQSPRYLDQLDTWAYNLRKISTSIQTSKSTQILGPGIRQIPQTILETLADTSDPHRPQYSDEAPIAAFMLMLSVPDLLAFARLAHALSHLFGEDIFPQLGMPAPRNLQAIVAGQNLAALRWDIDASALTTELHKVYVLYGTKNIPIHSLEYTESDILGPLEADPVELDGLAYLASMNTTVVEIDSNIASEDKPYHFRVVYIYKLKVDGKTQYTPVYSNEVVVSGVELDRVSLGVPPNWISVNLATLFPGIGDGIKELTTLIEWIKNWIGNASEAWQRFIEALDRIISLILTYAEKLLEIISDFLSILSALGSNVYISGFAASSGGNRFLQTFIEKAFIPPPQAYYSGPGPLTGKPTGEYITSEQQITDLQNLLIVSDADAELLRKQLRRWRERTGGNLSGWTNSWAMAVVGVAGSESVASLTRLLEFLGIYIPKVEAYYRKVDDVATDLWNEFEKTYLSKGYWTICDALNPPKTTITQGPNPAMKEACKTLTE